MGSTTFAYNPPPNKPLLDLIPNKGAYNGSVMVYTGALGHPNPNLDHSRTQSPERLGLRQQRSASTLKTDSTLSSNSVVSYTKRSNHQFPNPLCANPTAPPFQIQPNTYLLHLDVPRSQTWSSGQHQYSSSSYQHTVSAPSSIREDHTRPRKSSKSSLASSQTSNTHLQVPVNNRLLKTKTSPSSETKSLSQFSLASDRSTRTAHLNVPKTLRERSATAPAAALTTSALPSKPVSQRSWRPVFSHPVDKPPPPVPPKDVPVREPTNSGPNLHLNKETKKDDATLSDPSLKREDEGDGEPREGDRSNDRGRKGRDGPTHNVDDDESEDVICQLLDLYAAMQEDDE